MSLGCFIDHSGDWNKNFMLPNKHHDANHGHHLLTYFLDSTTDRFLLRAFTARNETTSIIIKLSVTTTIHQSVIQHYSK